jgi:hypothetical protein
MQNTREVIYIKDKEEWSQYWDLRYATSDFIFDGENIVLHKLGMIFKITFDPFQRYPADAILLKFMV